MLNFYKRITFYPRTPHKKGYDMLELKRLPPFDIVFTTNINKKLKLLDKYESLNSCKIKFDKISKMKIKIEEQEFNNNKKIVNKECKNSIDNKTNTKLDLNENNNPDIILSNTYNNKSKLKNVRNVKLCFSSSNPRGRPKTSQNDSKQMKACKQEIAHNKVRADQLARKTEHKDTLDYLLNQETSNNLNKTNSNAFKKTTKTTSEDQSCFNNNQFNISIASRETNNKIIHNANTESSILINDTTNNSDITLAIYNSNIVHENIKILTSAKRNITLKDLMFHLEKYKQTCFNQYLLNKIISKINN